MQTEYDDKVLEYWKLPNGSCIVQLFGNDGFHGNNNVKNALHSNLRALVVRYS